MQAPFPAAIAALPLPVDPQARRDLQRFSAPGIAANDPVQRATVLSASDEYAHPAHAPLHQAQANTDANVQHLANMVQQLDDRLGAIEVGLIGVQNCQVQALNRRRHTDPTQHLRPLQPLRKVRAGNGPGILGRPHGRLPPAVPVGTAIPSPPFPRTIHDTEAMTLDEINELAILMHDDFGIVHGDDLNECRDKLLRAITGE